MNKYDNLLFIDKCSDTNEASQVSFLSIHKYHKELLLLLQQLLKREEDTSNIPDEVTNSFHTFLHEAISYFEQKKEMKKENNSSLETIPEEDVLHSKQDYKYITFRDKFYTIDRFIHKKNLGI